MTVESEKKNIQTSCR